jgi:hypothetical protein
LEVSYLRPHTLALLFHCPAEIVEAKTATANALQEAEQGWRHANDMIAARGGLKGADSSWSAAA